MYPILKRKSGRNDHHDHKNRRLASHSPCPASAINRINDDPALGVPLDIPDNTPGALLLNFASATKPVFQFVYIMRELVNHLGQPSRLECPGWLFLDYALTTYTTGHHETLDLPTLFISANFK